MAAVEEIACGRRPPENWKTRIARPTAMSDSLVMRLSFFCFCFPLLPYSFLFSPYTLFFPPPPVTFPDLPSFSFCHREQRDSLLSLYMYIARVYTWRDSCPPFSSGGDDDDDDRETTKEYPALGRGNSFQWRVHKKKEKRRRARQRREKKSIGMGLVGWSMTNNNVYVLSLYIRVRNGDVR